MIRVLVVLAALFFFGEALAQVSMTDPPVGTTVFGIPSSTVAALPVCNTSATGQIMTVTNALTPVLGIAVVGGGAVTVLVHCDGTSWVVG